MKRNFILMVGFVLLCCTQVVGQSTLNVPSASYPTIQSAINATAQGDIVIVAPGTYVENLIFPARDFQLIGAGIGLTVVDGNNTGSCVNFTQGPVTNGMVIDGFTFKQGSGDLALIGASFFRLGGGIFIRSLYANAPLISPVFRNCEIAQNIAYRAAGIYIRWGGNVVFEGCRIRNNTVIDPGSNSVAIFTEAGATNTKFIDCTIENHTSVGGATVLISASAAEFVGCRFLNNTTWGITGIHYNNPNGGTIPPNLVVRNCSFIGGQSQSPSASVIWAGAVSPSTFENCLFANNTGGGMILGYGAGPRTTRNCTFANNQLGASPFGVMTFGSSNPTPADVLQVENSIFIDNTDSSGNAVDSIYATAGTPVVYRASIVETAANAPISPRPNFVDPTNDDFHLMPGSLGVNGGTRVGLTPPVVFPGIFLDLDGNPRVQLGEVDMGCYEAGHIAYSDASRGRVGESAGGPFDVVLINGSAGDSMRTVTIPLGTSSSMSMTQPPSLPNPVGFAIFGLIGEATPASITTVPLGIGKMTFAPCPLLPTHPALFTLTNNLGAFCPQLVPSTPTSWTSSPFPPIFFPLQLTFQGVIEESPGVYVPTNMVIYETK